MIKACAIALLALAAAHSPALPAQQIPSRDAEPTAELQLRVYQGFDARGHGRLRDAPLAIDVGTRLKACADGNVEIAVMNIGGWLYEVPDACARDAGRGSVAVREAPQPATITTRPAAPGPRPAPAVHCDPATWNCTTAAP